MPTKTIHAALLLVSASTSLCFATGAIAAPLSTSHDSAVCLAYNTQRKVDLKALEIFNMPEVQKARADAGAEWLTGWRKTTPEAQAIFPEALDELSFYATLATVSTEMAPSAMTQSVNQPHTINGKSIPGSRWAEDNTDNVYGGIPVDPRSSYRVNGKLSSGTSIYLSVFTAQGHVLSDLPQTAIKTDASGNFVLTLDSQTKPGLANHIFLPPTASVIVIRETLGNWTTAQPVYLQVRQVSGPIAVTPTDAVLAADTVARISKTVKLLLGYQKGLESGRSVNQLSPASLGQSNGGLSTQAYAGGLLSIKDNEAVVITVHAAGAAYLSAQLSNIWGTSGEFTEYNSTMNNFQSYQNKDGSYTYVVSVKDPGIQNWVSTQGLHDVIITFRWQQMKVKPGSNAGPSVSARLVKLADLRSILPAGVPAFTPVQRAEQIAARARNPYRLWAPAECDTGD